MLKNWIHIFYYHIKNNKLFTALNVLGLSIGISGLIFALVYYNHEKSIDAWNPEKDKVFEVISNLGENALWPYSVAPLQPYLEKEFPEVEKYCYFNIWYYHEMVHFNDKNEIIEIMDTQANFFEFFPFEFVKGNPKDCLSPTTMAIDETAAKKLFGDDDPMGKEVTYSGRKLVIKGVYKVNDKSSIIPEAVTNLIENQLKDNKEQWGNFNYGLLVKLKNPSDSDKVAKQLEKVYFDNRTAKFAKEQGISTDEFIKKYGPSLKVSLEPLAKAHLHSIVDQGYPEQKANYQFLMIMLGLSILILVLSIVNYVNLATANAIKRAKEVGVRKIIGATKSNIVFQFLFETILITLVAILLALVIVELTLPYYNDFLGKTFQLNGSVFYTQLILIFFIVIIFAGIFPALYVSNFETLKVLKGNFSRSKSGIWLRNGMLVFQFVIASFFIVGSYIVYQQVNYMANKDLGFSGEQVLQITYRNPYDWKEEGYKEKLFSRFDMIKHEISKIKGVEKVASGAFTFSNGATSSSGFTYHDINIQGQNMAVDFDMLDMMKIQIKEGRNLSPEFASDTISSMMVNETAAKMMNDSIIVGRDIKWNGTDLKIVGIVKDFHITGPQNEILPMSFFHLKTIDWMMGNVNKIYVKINPEYADETLAEIEKFWVKNIDTEYPFKYDFVDKDFARTYEQNVKQKNLFGLLNIIVIAIALFGLFALASYSIQSRMKEIAIRKTLGAETKTLLKDLSKQYLIFGVIGFALAVFPTYYLLQKWLTNFAYRIDIEAMPFIIGFIVLMFLTLIVVVSRAYQATKLDVLKYLKYE